jgi:hypothetical protein
MKDLVILVADKNMRAMVRALLARTQSLGIRDITVDVFAHSNQDPGVLTGADEFLAPFCRQYAYALVMFDREGCGQDHPVDELTKQVQERLNKRGWVGRSRVVVLDPELESWVWSDSPHVARALGLSSTDLDNLLLKEYGSRDHAKRTCPKEAIEHVLRHSGKPRSSSIYKEIAQRVSLRRCNNVAFLAFKECLREWFP